MACINFYWFGHMLWLVSACVILVVKYFAYQQASTRNALPVPSHPWDPYSEVTEDIPWPPYLKYHTNFTSHSLSTLIFFLVLVLVIHCCITYYPNIQWLKTILNIYFLKQFLWGRSSGAAQLCGSCWGCLKMSARVIVILTEAGGYTTQSYSKLEETS